MIHLERPAIGHPGSERAKWCGPQSGPQFLSGHRIDSIGKSVVEGIVPQTLPQFITSIFRSSNCIPIPEIATVSQTEALDSLGVAQPISMREGL